MTTLEWVLFGAVVWPFCAIGGFGVGFHLVRWLMLRGSRGVS